MHKHPTQLSRGPLMLLHYAETRGADRAELLEKSGLEPDVIADPDSRIPTKAMVRLWQVVIDEIDDPIMGLNVGNGPTVVDFGLVGYAMRYSDDLLGALDRLARYQRILSEAVRFSLYDKGDTCELTWVSHPALLALRHPVESAMMLLVRAARELTGADLHPQKVELPTASPNDSSVYKSEFRCEAEFGCEVARLTWTSRQMDLPIVTADAALVGYLDQLAAIAVGPIDADRDSTTTAVRRALWAMLPGGRPNIWRTAKELGVSVRTLQRRLGDEGSSFSQVLDTLRRDVTRELMAEGRQPAADISFLLGYSEPSAFHRAHRRWTEAAR